jgi:hypothetical protein
MGHYADYTSSLANCQPAKCSSPSGDACGHPQAFKSPAVSLIRGGRGNIAIIAGLTNPLTGDVPGRPPFGWAVATHNATLQARRARMPRAIAKALDIDPAECWHAEACK